MNLHAYRTTGKYSSMMRKNYDDKESFLPDLILLDSGRKKAITLLRAVQFTENSFSTGYVKAFGNGNRKNAY